MYLFFPYEHLESKAQSVNTLLLYGYMLLLSRVHSVKHFAEGESYLWLYLSTGAQAHWSEAAIGFLKLI